MFLEFYYYTICIPFIFCIYKKECTINYKLRLNTQLKSVINSLNHFRLEISISAITSCHDICQSQRQGVTLIWRHFWERNLLETHKHRRILLLDFRAVKISCLLTQWVSVSQVFKISTRTFTCCYCWAAMLAYTTCPTRPCCCCCYCCLLTGPTNSARWQL